MKNGIREFVKQIDSLIKNFNVPDGYYEESIPEIQEFKQKLFRTNSLSDAANVVLH